MTARMTPMTQQLLDAISDVLEARYTTGGKKAQVGFYVSNDGKGYQLSVLTASGHRRSELAPMNAHDVLRDLRTGFSAMGFGLAQQDLQVNAEGVIIAPKFLSEIIGSGALNPTSDLMPKFAAAVNAAAEKTR